MMTPECVHTMVPCAPPPSRMTYPFCYVPHPLCRQAADAVADYVESHKVLRTAAQEGKMFGVLVCSQQHPPHTAPSIVFLAAYSGLLAGSNNWPWFVPPIFDAQQPNGHFKQEEMAISQLNEEITALEQGQQHQLLTKALAHAHKVAQADVQRAQLHMKQAKLLRDTLRLQHHLEPEEQARLVAESQFLKAEVHRAKQRANERIALAEEPLKLMEQRIETLKTQRRSRSDALQHWLFSQYILRNAQGDTMPLLQLFSPHLPPAGSGDCCAPKLLQHAYKLGLKPLCMAEFWWGQSPAAQIRHHRHFYEACRNKCLPILTWMMRGLQVETNPHDMTSADDALHIIYEDDWLAVVSKPAGMPSVRGKIARRSAEDILRERWHDEVNPLIVHRLDMDTSGLMVAARTKWAHAQLQRQFENHQVKKRYEAIVSRPLPLGTGHISLPLRADIDDRPRQIVDFTHGKEAVTDYEVTACDGQYTTVSLWPQTGRTHQLRVHCAHAQGLAAPIVGDRLYGQPAQRLMLHAQWLALTHPHTGERMEWETTLGKWETR